MRLRAGTSRRVAWLLVVAFAGALAAPALVSAHALLRSSDPAAGSTLGSAPSSVLLTFGETPDPHLTSVQVLDSGGTDHATGSPQAASDPPNSIRVGLGALPDGVYTVAWRTVSAVDGHVSAGSFAFGVGVAPPSGPPSQGAGGISESGSPPAIAARWLLYLGIVALIGAAFVALAVARRTTPGLLALAAAGWLLAALGGVGVVVVQWIEVGAPLEDLPTSSIGISALARAVSLALVGAALAGLALARRLRGNPGWLLVGAAAAIVLGVDVIAGHAAAGADLSLQVASQWLHGLAAAWWIGGLLGLLLVLPSTPAAERVETARRFSFWAGIALAIVLGTGVVRATTEIGSVDALLHTDFGRVVLAKSAVFLGLAALGAFNHYVNLRNANRLLSGVRRIGGAELTLAVLAFGFSAWLVNLTPPTSAGGTQAPPPQPIVATGHDFGTSVRARLIATPGAAGQNTFDLGLTDYDSGQPVDASAASLRFQLESQSGVAPSTLDLAPAGQGSFNASGPNLSIDGVWQLTATVTTTSGTVEVPLIAATTVPAEAVQTIITPASSDSPGLPTIYVVQLGTAGSAQVYLDPGAPGRNDLHVTFFDPAGNELPTQAATFAVFPAAGDASIPAPRMLEPGHFVSTVDVDAGSLVVDIVSPLPDAGAGHLHVHVTIEVQQ